MDTRNEQPPKAPEPRKVERKRRFKIVPLEERIAPSCHYNPHGKLVGHYTRFCGGR